MTRVQKRFAAIAAAVVLILGGGVLAFVLLNKVQLRSPVQPVTLTGAVLTKDYDPREQTPIAEATVTATDGRSTARTTSDSSGFFHLVLQTGHRAGEEITLRVTQSRHKPVEITTVPEGQLYILKMQPLIDTTAAVPNQSNSFSKPVEIKNVQVRYTVKEQTTMNVGTIAREFDVINAGNIPCRGQQPCSPDGKWKAATGSLFLDAQSGNEFTNVRVSCIAGPCPFTRIDRNKFSRPSRTMTISALNWSDTASFLVEAEVTHTMPSDSVRISYPFVIGNSLSFALPPASEGPSLIADLNGEELVFPLGPNLAVSWATCSVESHPNRDKIYRCELKPGYQFQSGQ